MLMRLGIGWHQQILLVKDLRGETLGELFDCLQLKHDTVLEARHEDFEIESALNDVPWSVGVLVQDQKHVPHVLIHSGVESMTHRAEGLGSLGLLFFVEGNTRT